MSHKERQKCDLSASWSDESPLDARLASESSSVDENEHAEYARALRAMRLKHCATAGSEVAGSASDEEATLDDAFGGDDVAPPERDLEAEAEMRRDAERELDPELTFGKLALQHKAGAKHNVSQCPWQACTYALECSRCEAARRKRKQQEQQEPLQQQAKMSLQMPVMKPRTQTPTKNPMEAILQAQGRVSQPLPDSLPLQTPNLHYYSPKPAVKKVTTPPTQSTNKTLDATAKPAPTKSSKNNTNDTQQTKLPTMPHYGKGYTTLNSKVVYTEKRLDDLKAKPKPSAPTNLNSAYASRLNQQFSLASKAQSPAMAQALMHGFTPMDCHASGESTHNVLHHLKDVHPKFHDALELAGILEEIKKARKLDKHRLCFIFAVPPGELMTELRPDDATLRMHVIRTSEGIHLGNIKERTILATLNPAYDVELDYRDHHIYVNGYKAGRDGCYPGHIALIDVVLSSPPPSDLPPPMNAPEEEEEEEEGAISSTEEVELNDVRQGPVEEAVPVDTTQEVLSTRQNVTLATAKLLTKPFMNTLAQRMSMQSYQATQDLKPDCECVSQQAKTGQGTRLSLRMYDTQSIYAQWRASALPDLVRVKPVLCAQWDAAQSTQIRTNDAITLNEYAVGQDAKVALKDLSRGLLELSLASVKEPNRVTRVLCKLTPQATHGTQTYITANEQVMLRFHQGLLTHVTVNEHHTMSLDTQYHERDHFLEAHLSDSDRLSLQATHSKHEFDAVLLQASTLSKYTKKAKKYVTKKARDTMSNAQARGKRIAALKLQPVPHPEIITDLFAAPVGDSQGDKPLSVVVYDRKMRVRDSESQSGLSATRQTTSSNSVFYTVDSDNQLYNALQRTDNYYVDITLDQWKMSLNASLVSGRAQVYYAQGAGDAVYVLVFEGAGLKQVGKISSHSAQYKSMK